MWKKALNQVPKSLLNSDFDAMRCNLMQYKLHNFWQKINIQYSCQEHRMI